MGYFFRLMIFLGVVWLVYRLFIKKSGKKVGKTKQAALIQDLEYCSVCNSYVSSKSNCGRADCPWPQG